MIEYSKFTLDNGLKVIVHEDHQTPLAAVNMLYNVGARDEDENKTGFAHLFEHLMFGGSKHIPNFDEPLQRAGGESNAFTNNDMTNYYDTLPAYNIETAFWLESDRMMSLNIDNESLEVQRKVVCEEFKEHYLNQPYGDVWHKLCELSYKRHPYRWPTIGLDLSHIENAVLQDVKYFFEKYYAPNNAIMVVAGDVTLNEVKDLAEKWFGEIPKGASVTKEFTPEPEQDQPRFIKVESNVPVNAIYKSYHMGKRDSLNYYTMDLITEIRSTGASSRFYQKLIKEKRLFSSVEAYVTGSFDEGLLIVEGKMLKGVTMEQADEAIQAELDILSEQKVGTAELEKVKNKQESYHTFSEVNLLNRAIHLAYFELLGDASRINQELENYLNVTDSLIMEESKQVFKPSNCSTLHYYSKN